MTTTFINTNELPRVASAQGEFAEILNGALAGAKHVARHAAMAAIGRVV